jgi:hypothetical protein
VGVTTIDGHVDAEFVDCIANVARSLRFPPGPTQDTVNAPFHFELPQ